MGYDKLSISRATASQHLGPTRPGAPGGANRFLDGENDWRRR